MTKEYSVACDRNKDYILEVIKPLLKENQKVLEIGSGTGQHAVFFAEQMPHIIWQTADLIYSHNSINAWIEESKLNNILKPFVLDANNTDWHEFNFDFAFTANTFHIMSFEEVKKIFTGLNKVLNKDSFFAVYGPFNYDGKYTSESNRDFDAFLKEKYQFGGIRNFEDIVEVARLNNLEFQKQFDMPSNNKTLIFKKI